MNNLGWWIPDALPPVHYDRNAVKIKLKASKCIRNNRWAAFPKDPTDAKGHENVVFQGLEKVFADITKCARDSVMRLSDQGNGSAIQVGMNVADMVDGGNAPKFHFLNNLNSPIFYQEEYQLARWLLRTNRHRWSASTHCMNPNACSIAGTTLVFLGNIVKRNLVMKTSKTFTSIFQMKATPLISPLQNIQKAFWSMHCILHSDPCAHWCSCGFYGFYGTSRSCIPEYPAVVSEQNVIQCQACWTSGRQGPNDG
jgi:hypothetical protein